MCVCVCVCVCVGTVSAQGSGKQSSCVPPAPGSPINKGAGPRPGTQSSGARGSAAAADARSFGRRRFEGFGCNVSVSGKKGGGVCR